MIVAEFETSLLLAIQRDDLEAASKLFEQRVYCNAESYTGSRLEIASILGQSSVKMANLLLRKGFSANQHDSVGYTALHVAASQGNVELLPLLLEHGANVGAVDDKGQTALHVAALSPNPEVTRLLVKGRAPLEKCDRYGRTPLLSVCRNGNAAAARVLLKHGASPHVWDDLRNSALHYAVEGVNPEVVSELLLAGADANAANGEGYTPLQAAVRLGSHDSNRVHVLEALINAGCDLDRITLRGQTALHMACLGKDTESAKVLIKAGAKLDTIDSLGNTPLLQAARDGNYNLTELLFAAGAPVKPHPSLCDGNIWSEVQDPTVADLIDKFSYNVIPLVLLARTAFLRAHGTSANNIVKQIHLPPSLAKFVALETLW